MDMWRFLFGSVVARPAVVAICGGPAGRLTFRCVVVFGFAVPNRHFFHGSARYVVVINGRSVVPRKIAALGMWYLSKTPQMTWICSRRRRRQRGRRRMGTGTERASSSPVIAPPPPPQYLS